MQINGDKFLRNLEIERERAELERQKEELMSQKTQSYIKANSRYKEDEFDPEVNYQELDDIRLNKSSSNKQKYILLGFILILLFLITIVTIKLISEPKNGNSFGQNDVVDEKKMENSIPNVTPNTNANPTETKSLDIDKIIQSEDNVNVKPETKPIETTENKPAEGDIFGIAKSKEAVSVPSATQTTQSTQKAPVETIKPSAQTVAQVPTQATVKPSSATVQKEVAPAVNTSKPVTKEALIIKEAPVKPKITKEIKKDIIKKPNTPKVEQKKEVTSIETPSKSSQPSGKTGNIYIQVGAFSTVPDKALIVQLQKNNLKYTFQKLEKDGKQYSKLLVGGYATQDQALEDLVKIRNEINPKAFIPKGQ